MLKNVMGFLLSVGIIVLVIRLNRFFELKIDEPAGGYKTDRLVLISVLCIDIAGICFFYNIFKILSMLF